MKVITQYPVYVDKKLIGGEDYLSLDGKSSKAEIKEFQLWYNSRNQDKPAKLLPTNGEWDNNTNMRYISNIPAYTEYLEKKNKPATPKGEAKGLSLSSEAVAAQGKQNIIDKVGDALGLTDDKTTPDKKGMSKTVKYVLVGVGVLAVLGLGYALLKKK